LLAPIQCAAPLDAINLQSGLSSVTLTDIIKSKAMVQQ